MFSILNEIGNNSPFRTTSVVMASIGLSAFLYLLVAITGYLSFGNAVQGNIVSMCMFDLTARSRVGLLTTPSDPASVSATVAKAAIVILVMFSYPLQVHPCRASVDAVLKWRPKRRPDSPGRSPKNTPLLAPPVSAGQVRPDTMGDTRFAAITTAIIVLSYIVAMTVSSLEKVLAYVGSTGSTSISFILPGLFYYKISSPDSPLHQKLLKEDDDESEESDEEEDTGLLRGSGLLRRIPGRRQLLRQLSLALAIYGVVVMITCLVTNTLFVVAAH